MKALDNGKYARGGAPFQVEDLAARGLAPRSHWSEMSESEHFAQFYETDDSLLESLSGFIGEGLGAGDACVVVARETHRQGLEERLRAGGLDVDAAASGGRYVSLDSGETLAKLMADGSPEPERFAEVIGGVVARASEGRRRRVRIFGDMVALLCGEGNHAAAVRLEALWNELQRTHPFALFCGYALEGFGCETHGAPLGDLCAQHSRVIPAEGYNTLAEPEDRLRAVVRLQQRARLLEAEIAERKEAEKALLAVKEELERQVEEGQRLLVRERVARAEAESANRLKDEFLANVSHELRTPLTAIIGWAHMLRGGGLDEKAAARALETVERNARAQAQLVEDILDVSRVITGKLRLNIGPVDVAAVVNAAIDSVQLAADAKDIQLAVTLDPSARRVSGDSGRLQQVVWNLLSNAIKFTPPGGRVEVRLERAGADVQITVADTGDGISPEFLPFIFDRFRQADASSTRRHSGLGLGLAIVRHLVELHGGTVRADSEGPGRGATFTITLPLAEARPRAKGLRRRAAAPPPSADARTNSKPLPSLEGVRVLLVDDEEDSLRLHAFILAESKAEVLTASTVADALEVLRCYQPHVLVSDLAMPDEDGYTLIGRVRALGAEGGGQTPAVALTAYVRVEDRTRALSAGFNTFVPKPVEPRELIMAVANLTEADKHY